MADTVTRPPTPRQLEARARKAQKDRGLAWEKVVRARAALSQALDGFHDALGHETAAFRSLCAARGGRPAAETPAPPAPETLTSVDEED